MKRAGTRNMCFFFNLAFNTERYLFCSNGAALFFMIVGVVVDNQVSFVVEKNERMNK